MLTNNDIVQIVVNTLPQPHLIKEFDVATDIDGIRFSYRGVWYYVDHQLVVDEMEEEGRFIRTDTAILMRELLRMYCEMNDV